MSQFKKWISIGFLFGLVGAVSGCGKSPVVTASESGKKEATPSAQNSAPAAQPCGLKWDTGVCAQIKWIKGPIEGYNEFEISFSDDVLLSQVKVSAFMPGHGHGTGKPKLSQPEARVIRVSDLFFMMDGHWVIHVMLSDVDRTFDVDL